MSVIIEKKPMYIVIKQEDAKNIYHRMKFLR